MRIEYHPATTTDLNEAIRFYNQRQPGLGDDFLTEVYATIFHIQTNPLAFKETEGVRSALVKRFPYSVVFRLVNQQSLRILIIRHHRRRPEHGKYRQ